jgi:heat shock protein HslJ
MGGLGRHDRARFLLEDGMLRFALIAFLLAIFLPANAIAAPTLTGRYRIVAVAGVDGLDVARTDAEFTAKGRFASTIGCNRIAGMPAISGSQLTFGPMAATRMACPPPVDQVERAYLEALRNVRSFKATGATLIFLGEDGEPLLTLERQ